MENKDLHDFKQELIENEAFIRWVKSDFVYDNEHWSQFVDDNMDQMDDINAAIGFVRNLSFVEIDEIDKDKLWQRIDASTEFGRSIVLKPKERSIMKYIIGIAAAACLIFMFVYRLGFSGITDVQTGIAQDMTEKLPDGSSVRMNANTQIKYNLRKWDTNREISLSGLAFFEVSKGSKFTVITDKGVVTVLGTSFSVDTRNDNFEVVCKTGKVSVKSSESTEVVLNPGDMARLTSGKLQLESNDGGNGHQIHWLEGMYTFENKTISEVIVELESQYDIHVKLEKEMDKLQYTGFFKKGNLEEALKSVFWPLQLQYRIEGKNVYITK